MVSLQHTFWCPFMKGWLFLTVVNRHLAELQTETASEQKSVLISIFITWTF